MVKDFGNEWKRFDQSIVKKSELKNIFDQYIKMLEAGGTLRHRELLKPFGLDSSDLHFWQGGLNIISGFIDELE